MNILPRQLARLLDPGWPWLLAGVLLLVAAGVIPSEQRLIREQQGVLELEAERDRLRQISATYARFLTEIDRGEETVVRRLAAAQLGILPEGHRPLVILSGVTDPPTRWIERAALQPGPSIGPPTASAGTHSLLIGLLGGTGQLWIFGASLVLIFVGLLLGPSTVAEDSGPSAAG